MKRTSKGDKNARARKFAQTHRRAPINKYEEGWDKQFEERLKSEWAKKHPTEDTPEPKKNNPDQNE